MDSRKTDVVNLREERRIQSVSTTMIHKEDPQVLLVLKKNPRERAWNQTHLGQLTIILFITIFLENGKDPKLTNHKPNKHQTRKKEKTPKSILN